MFDIGFSELLLIFIIGLVVLGPKRLPVAVKTVAGWLRAIRSLATSVQTELNQELKMQEMQDYLKKAEKVNQHAVSPELKQSIDELREVTASMQISGRTPGFDCGPAEQDSAILQGGNQSDNTASMEPASARIFPAPTNSDNT